jgi:hypothetical protein
MSQSEAACKRCGSPTELTWDPAEQDGYLCAWCWRLSPLWSNLREVVSLLQDLLLTLERISPQTEPRE